MNGLDVELAADIASFHADPLKYALYAYPWGEGQLASSAGPRQWQRKAFAALRDHLQGAKRFQPFQLAVASGHGIGKSAFIAMLIGWALDTREDTRVVVTANTETQLRTKTWPEVSKWMQASITSGWHDVTATSIAVKDKGHERLWRADMIPWSENNTEAFAGLHNEGKRIVVVYDEASSIADKIWEVTEGALTDENTEIIWIAFGNPTRNTGRFRECFGRYKHRWHTYQVDSRTVEGTNKQQLDKWVLDYGEDSDFCRVRVRGEFPRAGSAQFISGDSVAEARRNIAEGYEHFWKILTVDVARFGDDQTVIGLRQGPRFRVLSKLRGQDVVQTSLRVMQHQQDENPRETVIDGDGIGGGVVDYLKHHGHGGNVHEFHGGSTPSDPQMYFNRRAEVWGLMRAWLMQGADIPDDAELADDLIGPEYFFSSKNTIQLERKEDMKKRGLASPDCADALAMSFAVVGRAKTRDELLEDKLAVATPMEAHLIRWNETVRREKDNESLPYWMG